SPRSPACSPASPSHATRRARFMPERPCRRSVFGHARRPTSSAMGPSAARQLAFDLPHRPASGADDFLVAPPNAAAVAWVDRWPDWPAAGLALHGAQGSGKTHLLRVWQARSGARLLRAADLADLDFNALATSPGPAAVDDCDNALPERALLHLYNLL